MVSITIDDRILQAEAGELLVDLINQCDGTVRQVCYHPQLGPVQTCDTCIMEVKGQLVRACATAVADGMKISTNSSKVKSAQVEAFDRILSNHLLYCTVCDNNNGKQPCRPGNQHAYLQRNKRSHERARGRREPTAAHKLAVRPPDAAERCGSGT